MITQFPELPGSVDHQLCPQSPDLLACVADGDLWLCSAARSSTHRLTDTATHRSKTLLTAGQPSFIIQVSLPVLALLPLLRPSPLQEEFDRYTGFWWQPGARAGVLAEVVVCCVLLSYPFLPTQMVARTAFSMRRWVGVASTIAHPLTCILFCTGR